MEEDDRGVGRRTAPRAPRPVGLDVDQCTCEHDVVPVECSWLEEIELDEPPIRPSRSGRRDDRGREVSADVREPPGGIALEQLAVAPDATADVEEPRRLLATLDRRNEVRERADKGLERRRRCQDPRARARSSAVICRATSESFHDSRYSLGLARTPLGRMEPLPRRPTDIRGAVPRIARRTWLTVICADSMSRHCSADRAVAARTSRSAASSSRRYGSQTRRTLVGLDGIRGDPERASRPERVGGVVARPRLRRAEMSASNSLSEW